MYNQLHPSHLVNHHFTPDSFQVVREVHHKMSLLHCITEHLHALKEVNSNLYKIDGISQHLGDIARISDELRNLVELHQQLPTIQELYPHIKAFSCTLADVQEKLDFFQKEREELTSLMNSNNKVLEDRMVQYEQELQCLISKVQADLCDQYQGYLDQMQGMVQEVSAKVSFVENNFWAIEKAIETQNETKVLLEHLKASDLVTNALFTGLEEDSAKALKQIKESERWGNDELVLRARLNYKLPESNVLQVLRENQERLTNEREGGML